MYGAEHGPICAVQAPQRMRRVAMRAAECRTTAMTAIDMCAIWDLPVRGVDVKVYVAKQLTKGKRRYRVKG